MAGPLAVVLSALKGAQSTGLFNDPNLLTPEGQEALVDEQAAALAKIELARDILREATARELAETQQEAPTATSGDITTSFGSTDDDVTATRDEFDQVRNDRGETPAEALERLNREKAEGLLPQFVLDPINAFAEAPETTKAVIVGAGVLVMIAIVLAVTR